VCPNNRDHRERQHDIADSVRAHDEHVSIGFVVHRESMLDVFNIREGRLSRKIRVMVLTPVNRSRLFLLNPQSLSMIIKGQEMKTFATSSKMDG
jgi:ATP-dependent 26S proteasome regulatory subunit